MFAVEDKIDDDTADSHDAVPALGEAVRGAEDLIEERSADPSSGRVVILQNVKICIGELRAPLDSFCANARSGIACKRIKQGLPSSAVNKRFGSTEGALLTSESSSRSSLSARDEPHKSMSDERALCVPPVPTGEGEPAPIALASSSSCAVWLCAGA